MPLYKKQPFPLAEKPSDLKPNERVFQVRFTKELFRGYSDYLKRINLYRQRVWTSKATGKTNLTYEEALISEKKAAEKVKQFPKEFTVPVLREVQFSMLPLKDLTNAIFDKLNSPLSEGNELYARKNNHVYPCKIVKVLEGGDEYEVLWLGKDKKKVTGNSLLKGDDFIKKLPLTKEILKSFIRESTYRYSPWVLHDNLAKLHGISSYPPKDLGVNLSISIQNGLVVCSRKRKKVGDDEETLLGQSQSQSTTKEIKKQRVEPIKYPIDDLLVERAEDDDLIERPSLCKDFNVPVDCVGDLLMIWDFCTSFGKLLYLSPFSLEHFENAICHKDSNVILVAETHSSLLLLLMKDNGGSFSDYMRIKKRKPKITLVTWSDYLCDFLDNCGISELSSLITTIRRGHYGLLDVDDKLKILRELINQALETNLFREKLDEYVEEGHAFAATRRGEAIHEGKMKRVEEKKEQLKKESSSEEVSGKDDVIVNDSSDLPKCNNEPLKRKILKLMKHDIKETIEKKSKEQRKEYLQREIEKRLIRTNCLGKDRKYNRYWFFRREGRIFMENSESMEWGYYCNKDEVDAFMGSLNVKGFREKALKKQLEKHYAKICYELQKKTKELAQRSAAEEEAELRRSTRVRAPPRENPGLAFMKYENRWKD